MLQPLLPEISGWVEEVRERNDERYGGILLRAMNGNQRNMTMGKQMRKKENKNMQAKRMGNERRIKQIKK